MVMNANELADWIENGAPFGEYETAKQAVIMLRQQQAEIRDLQQQVAFLEDYRAVWAPVVRQHQGLE